MIKTIFMIYAVLFLHVSVIRIETMDGESFWSAHDQPQDGYGGHNGKWVNADTAKEAVWELYHS